MPTILFLAESCLLDRKSGAAQSALAMLQVMAKQGWSAHAVTMNACDGDDEFPLAQFGARLDPLVSAGKVVTIADAGVTQQVYVTHSTVHQNFRPWEVQAFLAMAQDAIRRIRPDIVLTYSSELLRPLLAEARQGGARTVFYVANPAYAMREGFSFEHIDHFIMPSRALVDLYREKMGIEGTVVRNLVDTPFDGTRNLDPARIASRRDRRITMINPDPAKGGLFFFNIVSHARTTLPDLRFRAVESRWGRSQWEGKGSDFSRLTNLEWHPNTQGMGKVYEEAALLLVPSLWFEASGRVIAEGLLAGLPILAMRSGGIADQLNDGGFLFDVPPAMKANHVATPPPADVAQWVKFIQVLMNDDALYGRAVTLALKASAIHQRPHREAEAAQVFADILAAPAVAGIEQGGALDAGLLKLRDRMRDLLAEANAAAELAALAPDDTPDARSDDGGAGAYFALLRLSLAQPALAQALAAVNAHDNGRARQILEQYLRVLPDDITALGLLGEVAAREDNDVEALRLMSRVVELAPGFLPGQEQLLRQLQHASDAEGALKYSEALIRRAAGNPVYQAYHARLLVTANRPAEAIAVFETLFPTYPGRVQDWTQYALALKTIGRQDEGVAAYRKAIDMASNRAQGQGSGQAWHALSNMKLAVFSDNDIQAIEQQLNRDTLAEEDRYNLHFTLGKAFEDKKAYEPSFRHYAKANATRHAQSAYDPTRIERFVAEAKALFTPEFFAARKGQGNPAADPVFVLGLHRAGSTLTEQILASHSQIEGTRELPDMLRIGRHFGNLGGRGEGAVFNGRLLARLVRQELVQLGQTYLDTSAASRMTDRPLFVDKMPANWMYAGLIHLILPNAKIIDIRRKPMAAGFALFKMNFGKGVDHAYSQTDIARYYLAYADLMAHFDAVLPGRIHHIQYEQLVDRTEDEIRRLIDYCGVPFEPGCLRYWETDRAIQTPSSEQVRQPIFSSAVEQWKNYAPWLGEMRDAFGDAVDDADTVFTAAA